MDKINVNFMNIIENRAKSDKKTIVLPESVDIRTLEATSNIIEQDIANIILIGDKDEIIASANGFDISKAIFINPNSYEKIEELVSTFYDIRKNKGMTKEKAMEILKADPLYFGVMLVKCGIADGMVAGAINSTGDVLRPALQIIKTAKDTKVVSSFFFIQVPDSDFGENGMFLFSDAGLNQYPTEEQLCYIAISSAKSFKQLTNVEPIVAMLSHSSKMSAHHPEIDKVTNALKLVHEKEPEINIDGELQLDAAIVPEIAAQKAPESTVAGKANVLIFPNIDAGNIGYKLVQRLAKADAYGPITQGLAKPVNDLSRGCSSDDIVGVVAITVVQAQIQN